MRREIRRVLAVGALAALLAVVNAAAQPAPSPALPTLDDPLTAEREVNLARQLRCLVCQNETIADSRAELAQDLRARLREQMAAGKSDEEIIDYMTARYGDFVLYKPPLKATTALLWFGPFLLVAVGAAVALLFVRSRRRAAAPQLTDAQRRRAAELLRADGKGKS
jgi:cytochrome c-type biogenesis protein CcmH